MPVGLGDHIEVGFNLDDAVAAVDETVQHTNQALDIGHVQADRGEEVDRFVDLHRQHVADAFSLSADHQPAVRRAVQHTSTNAPKRFGANAADAGGTQRPEAAYRKLARPSKLQIYLILSGVSAVRRVHFVPAPPPA